MCTPRLRGKRCEKIRRHYEPTFSWLCACVFGVRYSGGATTADALAAGIPVVALVGGASQAGSPVARLSVSQILGAAQQGQRSFPSEAILVVSMKDYENAIVDIAQFRAALSTAPVSERSELKARERLWDCSGSRRGSAPGKVEALAVPNRSAPTSSASSPPGSCRPALEWTAGFVRALFAAAEVVVASHFPRRPSTAAHSTNLGQRESTILMNHSSPVQSPLRRKRRVFSVYSS